MKKEIPLSKVHRIINHGPVVMVTSQLTGSKPNILSVAWTTPLSQNPPLVAISIAESHYSYQIINENGEFVINVPSTHLASQVLLCGQISGREVNKFEISHLTPIPSQKVGPPLINECIGHLECIVVERIQTGDHGLFIGKVVAASAEEKFFDDRWHFGDGRYEALHHLGGNLFAISKYEMDVRLNENDG